MTDRHFPSRFVGSTRFWLGLILAGYLILGVAYGLVNPLFEAPDEHNHFFTAQYIARHNALPRVETPFDPWMRQEAAQPPLYYWLASWLIRPFDTANAQDAVWLNPQRRLGDATALTNRNVFVHTAAEQWPWADYVRAAHLVRLFSTLLGLGTLLAIFGAGRRLWPDRPGLALLATGLVAFLPQFLFLHASVSNDPLIIFFSSLTLWWLLKLWREGVTTGRSASLGIFLGLAILSKTAGLALAVYAAIFLALRSWRDVAGEPRRWWRQLVLSLWPAVLVALLLAGWLLLRNWQLYGDPTATNQFVLLEGSREITLWEVFAETPGIWYSFFAVFGWFSVRLPDWAYWLWASVGLVGLAGLLWRVYQRPSGRDWGLAGLLAFWPLLVYGGMVSFMLRTPAAQGRLLFPALLPLALGLAYGWSQWGRWRWAAPGLLLLAALTGLLWTLPATYARPEPVATLPATATPVGQPLGAGLELLGYELSATTLTYGEVLWLELYWRADRVPATAPQLVVEFLGRDEALMGKSQSYHAGGLYPANLWPAGVIIPERIGIRLDGAAELPSRLRAQLRLVDETPVFILPPLKGAPLIWPDVPVTELARLGEAISLREADLPGGQFRPGEQVTVAVTWAVLAPPGQNWTTFLHLGQPDAPPLATGDSPPLRGYYPTSFWAAGEVVRDEYTLWLPEDIPAGSYTIWLGQYDESGRNPLTVAGQRQPADAFAVGTITVTPR